MNSILSTTLVILLSVHYGYSGNKDYRLPVGVVPYTYLIKLHPQIDQDSFRGEVTIFVKSQKDVESITMHSKNLTILKVKLDNEDVTDWHHLDADYHLLHIRREVSATIFPGEHIINVEFAGQLVTDPKAEYGLRKVKYNRKDGTSGYLIVSDLEATYARLIYPCFDEPHLKAKFTVRLVAPNDTYEAISNMKVIAKHETESGVIYDFQPSVPMSTYLTTFVITDYPYSEMIWNNDGVNIPIRAYSPHAKNKKNQVVLETAQIALEYFTNYTGIKYPLPKLDMIEFSRNVVATEDWGIITFLDGYLSPSQEKVSEIEMKLVILHEICHFWFGNLVTNYWWNDIWLHEGFAEYLSGQAYDRLYDANVIRTSTDGLEYVYTEDLTNNPQSVVQTLVTETEIEQHFGDVIYVKGAAILRQVELIMGSANFQSALKNYISKYAFKTATTGDLINEFEDVVDNAYLRKFLLSWSYQRGHPILYVQEDEETDEIILRQETFPSKNKRPESEMRQKWTIPVVYYTSEDRKPTFAWFDEDIEELRITKHNATWINLNYQEIGIYRVNYTHNQWEAFRSNFHELEEEEQRSLLKNAYDLFANDLLPCGTILDLYYKREAGAKDVDLGYPSFSIRIQAYVYETDFLEPFTEYTYRWREYDAGTIDDLVKSNLEKLKTVVNTVDKIGEDQVQCVIDWIKDNVMTQDWVNERNLINESGYEDNSIKS